MGVVAEIDDVFPTSNVLALILESVDDQRHEVVSRLEVSSKVMVSRDPVGRDVWPAWVLLDEILCLSHITEDLEILVVTTIHVLAVHEVSTVENLLDTPRLERVIGEVHQVEPLCIRAEMCVGDEPHTTFRWQNPREVCLEVVRGRCLREVERAVELCEHEVRVILPQFSDGVLHLLCGELRLVNDVLELVTSGWTLEKSQHPLCGRCLAFHPSPRSVCGQGCQRRVAKATLPTPFRS